MKERIEYFTNQQGQRLLGVLQPCRNKSNLGVLFCHPISEEKHASYRTLVEFSRMLSTAGIPSLRFDCRGFGDSEGGMVEVNLNTQVEDVMLAMSALKKEFDLTKIVLIGVRLGANVARLVAQIDKRVAALILISPIILGEKYWRGMLREQQMSFIVRGVKPLKKEELLSKLAAEGYIEIKAELFSKQFINEISSINLLEDSHRYTGPHLITALQAEKPMREATSKLIEHYKKNGIQVSSWLDEEAAFWSEKALFDLALPECFFSKTINWINGLNS